MKKLNKFLTEATGECCPKFFETYGYHRYVDFLTWEGFGKLWEWAIVQKWWPEFEAHQGLPKHWVPKKLIKPEFFAKAVADFLQKK